MPEDRQFRQRLEAWLEELKQELFTPVCTVSFRGAFTRKCLTLGEAETLPLFEMKEGTPWGENREYGWFFADMTVPEGAQGKRLVFLSGLGGEQLVFVNGGPQGSLDKEHRYVTLKRQAEAGEKMHIAVESYAGHGARLENTLPCPPGRRAVPPVPEKQCVIKTSCAAVFEENVFQLLMDAQTLAGTAQLLPDGDERRNIYEQALRTFTHTADPELEYNERMSTYQRARECMREALETKGKQEDPVLHLIGQSHIDLAWLWPMEETLHKVRRTYANQLSLMEEYPEYRFLACEPRLLEMLRETDERQYDRLLSLVKEGRMIPDGAFYVECDTNIPSGESLVRQLMLGKRWFRKEMGAKTRVAWQPDTFGFTSQLPQIMHSMEIPYFATQKLLRADPECERFPYQDFMWEGADGTRVQALSFFKSNARTDPKNLWERWHKHSNPQGDADSQLYPFGFGDGGGGAERDMLEFLKREKDLAGLPKTRWSSPEEYFLSARERAKMHVWQGELYLSWHRGTYTVQRGTKVGIKRLERQLHDAEMLACQLPLKEREPIRTKLSNLWRVLLTHQFHDVCAGVGLRCVHREAEETLSGASREAEELIAGLARQAFATGEEGTALLNTLSFSRREYVTLPNGKSGYVTLPPSGTLAFHCFEPIRHPVAYREENGCIRAENGLIRFEVRQDGCIYGLTDLRTGKALQRPHQKMNCFRVYKNVEPVYDAWELSRDYIRDLIPDGVIPGTLQVEKASPEELTLRFECRILSSPCVQRIRFYADRAGIDFETEIDWQEKHRLLKACFETDLCCREAMHDMQFCHVMRPAHDDTAFARDRYEVCSHRYTAYSESDRCFAVLSRDIFGVRCRDNGIHLTLLRSPCVPDESCDRGLQRLEYAIRVYDAPFENSGIFRDGEAYQNPPRLLPFACLETVGFFAENAEIDTVKPAEDGPQTVLRLHESKGMLADAVVHLPNEYSVCIASMDERVLEKRGKMRDVTLRLHPFEIVTLMLE